ncbi:uncharacterized protein LOC142632804 [Castanea sativa]|uniref:uncharacterized protein LOC142632804 n=1 Tax=Castanea sativa TaxID=21020 RepID=UPI003F64F2E8
MASKLPNNGEKLRLTDDTEWRDLQFSHKVGLSTSIRQEDIISELPTDVLSSILSYLTLRDAVKTSVLSHRWTRICASRLSLIFDRRNIMPFLGYPCMDYKHIFVGAVNQFLQFYEVPKLEEVYFQVSNEQSAHYIFHQLAKDLLNLRMLHVVTIVNWVSIPKSIVIFSKVETLELYFGRRMEFDVLKMTAILRAFPLLQKFYLQEVHLAGFYGTSTQIKFAIYLLKNAPALKRLVIDPKEKCGLVDSFRQVPRRERKNRSWNEGERERVCEQMQEFSKDVLLVI